MGIAVIQSITLGANQNTVDFTNIPQTYKHLWLLVSSRASAPIDWFEVGINGQTPNSGYFTRYIFSEGNTVTTGDQTPAALALTGPNPGSNIAANTFSNSEVYFFNYTGSLAKRWTGLGTENNTSLASMRQSWFENTHTTTSPITSIRVQSQDSAVKNLVTNTSITLYGLP